MDSPAIRIPHLQTLVHNPSARNRIIYPENATPIAPIPFPKETNRLSRGHLNLHFRTSELIVPLSALSELDIPIMRSFKRDNVTVFPPIG